MFKCFFENTEFLDIHMQLLQKSDILYVKEKIRRIKNGKNMSYHKRKSIVFRLPRVRKQIKMQKFAKKKIRNSKYSEKNIRKENLYEVSNKTSIRYYYMFSIDYIYRGIM